MAAVVSDVPNAVLSAEVAMRSFLESELAFALAQAVDQHVIDAIESAAPPAG
ncbi:MAG: hypothetical protein ACRDL1_06400 [Solirubrobacterales bacterium]